MHQDSEQTSLFNQIDTNSESFKLKISFTQRNLQRTREENIRLSQKIRKLEEQKKQVEDINRNQKKQIEELEKVISNERREKEALIHKIQIRTQRYEAQKNKNMTVLIEKDLVLMRQEKQSIQKKYQELVFSIQKQVFQKNRINQKLVDLQKNYELKINENQQSEKLYQQKIDLIQAQNNQLRKQIDSLVLEVKLFERKKQIQNLLNYQNRIGAEQSPIKITKERHYNEYQYQLYQYETKLSEKQQLIDLLKQKNQRLSKQIECLKKRCSNLQSIICKSAQIK